MLDFHGTAVALATRSRLAASWCNFPSPCLHTSKRLLGNVALSPPNHGFPKRVLTPPPPYPSLWLRRCAQLNSRVTKLSLELQEEQEMNNCLRANQTHLQSRLAEEERKGKESGEPVKVNYKKCLSLTEVKGCNSKT